MKYNYNLIQYFEQTAENFPDKTAVIDATGSLCFKDLQTRSQILGDHLTEIVNGNNTPIAIYLPKSNEAITAIIGVLYSGNIYTPLDIKSPGERIKSIVDQLQPGCIITDLKNKQRLEDFGVQKPLITIDEIDFSTTNKVPKGYEYRIDTDPAYIIHTSGSTGTPKGVVISHRSIFDYIHWAIDTFDISEKEIIGNQAPLVFDNSTLDIHLMIFTGATLCLIPEQLFMFPAKLLEYLNEYKVNFIFWVPSVLIHVANLELLEKIKTPYLRKVLFAGEVMPTKSLNHWIKNLDNNVLFANLYGPTEITVDCTYYIVDRDFDDQEVLPIGKACRNSDVLILNKQDDLCKIGEEGELCVRGSSLALGYWRNFEKTNSVFIQNPLNSNYPESIYRTGDIVYKNQHDEIIFVGRKDNQIKHLGYRIELGEIEHTVTGIFKGISACAIYDDNRKKLVLVYASEQEIPVMEFRKNLITRLSKYMIPTQYIHLSKLPLNNSGKIDRKKINSMLMHKELA